MRYPFFFSAEATYSARHVRIALLSPSGSNLYFVGRESPMTRVCFEIQVVDIMHTARSQMQQSMPENVAWR